MLEVKRWRREEKRFRRLNFALSPTKSSQAKAKHRPKLTPKTKLSIERDDLDAIELNP